MPTVTTTYAATLTDSSNATMTTASLVINPDSSFTMTSTGAIPFTASGTISFPAASSTGALNGTIIFTQPVTWNGLEVRQVGSYSLGGNITTASASAFTGTFGFFYLSQLSPGANFQATSAP